MLDFDFSKLLNPLLQVWDRGSLFLWAIGVAALAAAGVVGVMHEIADSPTTWLPTLLIGGAILVVLATFKTYQERTVQTLVFVPNEMQSFWHHAPQPNGRQLTQIAIRGTVTNKTDKPVYPTDIRLILPRVSRVMQKNIFTEHPGGRVYGGDNPVPPGARAGFSAHFFVEGFVGTPGNPLNVIVSISDQLDHWHRVKYSLIRPEDR